MEKANPAVPNEFSDLNEGNPLTNQWEKDIYGLNNWHLCNRFGCESDGSCEMEVPPNHPKLDSKPMVTWGSPILGTPKWPQWIGFQANFMVERWCETGVSQIYGKLIANGLVSGTILTGNHRFLIKYGFSCNFSLSPTHWHRKSQHWRMQPCTMRCLPVELLAFAFPNRILEEAMWNVDLFKEKLTVETPCCCVPRIYEGNHVLFISTKSSITWQTFQQIVYLVVHTRNRKWICSPQLHLD